MATKTLYKLAQQDESDSLPFRAASVSSASLFCLCLYLSLSLRLSPSPSLLAFFLKVSVLNLKRSFLWNQSYSCTMGGGSSKASPKAEPRDEKTERQEKDDEATLTEVPSPCRIICFQLQIIV